MAAFRFDVQALEETRASAAALASAGAGKDIVARARDGETPTDVELAALVVAPDVDAAAVLAAARRRRPVGGPRLETFSPLYLTNECDAECRMCGMRATNRDLLRETADGATVEAQLDILADRGVRGVALLTGEYRQGAMRRAMLARTNAALRAALARGFRHVLINVGALDAAEYDALLASVVRRADGRIRSHVTMCTFQESYSPDAYARFMGTSAGNPRADFRRRLENFDRAADAGMWSVNPGVLLGLHGDVAFELLALLAHGRHLEARGLRVYVSLPRLRRATGTPYPAGVSDDTLARIVGALALGLPEARIVISTREAPPVQRRLLPVIGVLTPGSPGVAPYTPSGARFALEASQFEVLDHRPIETILDEYVAAGATFDCYEPAARA